MTRPRILYAESPTLEKRLELAKAILALAAPDERAKLWSRQAECAAVRRELEQITLSVQELRRNCDPRQRSYVIKYSLEQPRVTAGNPDGGQWTSESEGGS